MERTIPLNIDLGHSHSLVGVTFSDESSHFCRLVRAVDGVKQELGLRVDMAKRAILDQVGIAQVDARLGELRDEIIATVISERTPPK